MALRSPTARGHAKARDSILPTQGARKKRENPSPELNGPHRSEGVHLSISKGPHQSMEVHHPNLEGHSKAWEFISPIQEARTKRESESCQPEDQQPSVGV